MAKIERKKQKIFALNSQDVKGEGTAIYGSCASGNIQFSKDIDDIQSSKWEEGQKNALIVKSGVIGVPVQEDYNSLFYVLSKQIAYNLQQGIPEYLNTETYYENCFCSQNGNIYVCVNTSTVGITDIDPETDDGTNWKKLIIDIQTVSNLIDQKLEENIDNMIPSNDYIELTWAGNFVKYTAPANGYVYFNYSTSTNIEGGIRLLLDSARDVTLNESNIQQYTLATNSIYSFNHFATITPVRKNQLFCGRGVAISPGVDIFRFIYAKNNNS